MNTDDIKTIAVLLETKEGTVHQVAAPHEQKKLMVSTLNTDGQIKLTPEMYPVHFRFKSKQADDSRRCLVIHMSAYGPVPHYVEITNKDLGGCEELLHKRLYKFLEIEKESTDTMEIIVFEEEPFLSLPPYRIEASLPPQEEYDYLSQFFHMVCEDIPFADIYDKTGYSFATNTKACLCDRLIQLEEKL